MKGLRMGVCSVFLAAVAAGVMAFAAPVLASDQVAKVQPQVLEQFWVRQGDLSPPMIVEAAMFHLEGCYVVAYTIDSDGSTRDVEMDRSHVTFANRPTPVLDRRQRGRAQRDVSKAQEAKILQAVQALRFTPAASNAARTPIRTTTVPIVVAAATLEDPEDPVKVKRDRALYAERHEALFRQCSGQ